MWLVYLFEAYLLIGIQLSKNPINHTHHRKEEQIKEMPAGCNTSGTFSFCYWSYS
jgi:hypothetical protein